MNYEALGIYTAHKDRAIKLSSEAKELFSKLENIARLSDRGGFLVAKYDKKRLKDITDRLMKIDDKLNEAIEIANKYANDVDQVALERPLEI